MDWDFTENIAF